MDRIEMQKHIAAIDSAFAKVPPAEVAYFNLNVLADAVKALLRDLYDDDGWQLPIPTEPTNPRTPELVS
jgi:hypothetical protein